MKRVREIAVILYNIYKCSRLNIFGNFWFFNDKKGQALWYFLNTWKVDSCCLLLSIAYMFRSLISILLGRKDTECEHMTMISTSTKIGCHTLTTFFGRPVFDSPADNLVPRLFPLVEERPWLGLVTCHAGFAWYKLKMSLGQGDRGARL